MKILPEFAPLFADADVVDVKTVESRVSIRQFLAAMFAYQPVWITLLYRVRAVFVRFLGMRQNGVPRPTTLTAEQIPMTPGKRIVFFTTRAARDDAYWFGGNDAQHLDAILGVVVEPLTNGLNRFHVVTIVHYHNWAGPIYFNVIRPFHHLVVKQMAKAGAA